MELVVGVLSAANRKGVSRRNKIIGNTWSKDHKGCIYFVGAGNWSNIKKEFEEDQDLIWVNMEENWMYLSYKVQTFFHAIEDHFGLPYDYTMKADDDSYVLFLPAFDSFLKKYDGDIDYFGRYMQNTKAKVKRIPGHPRYNIPTSVYSPDTYPPYAYMVGGILFLKISINVCSIILPQ